MKTTTTTPRFFGALAALLLASAACTGNIGSGQADGAGADGGVDPTESGLAVGPSPLTRLTRIEYERTLQAIFPPEVLASIRFDRLAADGKSGRFESNGGLSVNVDSADAYRIVAEDVGAAAATHVEVLLPCGETDACVEGFVRDEGELLYRRPLDQREIDLLVGFYRSERDLGASHADAVRQLVTAILQMPAFLYRLERGATDDATAARLLTAHELASRLSFFLWRSGPDKELIDAATRGDLGTPEGIETQARRLLADARADFALVQFHTAWLGLEDLANHQVQATDVDAFEELKDDMVAETQAFVLEVFRNDDARMETLLTASYSFASPELQAFYGDAVVDVGPGGRVTLDPARRAGILTQASFLTTHAPSPTRAAIYRGKSILVDFFCTDLTLPDDFDPPTFDPSLPSRQQVEQLTSGNGCNSCHQMINPLGFTFENYDAIGRWRDVDVGQPVNAAADVKGTDVDGPVVGATELARKLAASDRVAQCLSRQWLRYALSRVDDTLDDRSIEIASTRAGGDLRELLVALTGTDAFRYRRLAPVE